MRRLIFCVLAVVVLASNLAAQPLTKIGQLTSGYSKDSWDYQNNTESGVVLNGIAYFAADDGYHGTELWRSDGTEEGTWMVKDIYHEDFQASSRPRHFFVHNNEIYFAARGLNGEELYKSDGTANGTVMVADINPNGSSNPYPFASFNGDLYLFANNPQYGMELYKWNGTQLTLMETVPGSAGSGIYGYTQGNFYWYDDYLKFNNVIIFDNSLYFNAEVLWRIRNGILEKVTDENGNFVRPGFLVKTNEHLISGTHFLSTNFFTIQVGAHTMTKYSWASYSTPQVINNEFYFLGSDNSLNQSGIFSFDGTNKTLEHSFNISQFSSVLGSHNSQLFLLKKNGESREFWVYDGNELTLIGTPWIIPDPNGQYKKYNLTIFNNDVYFLGKTNNGFDDLLKYSTTTKQLFEFDFNDDENSIGLLNKSLITNNGLLFICSDKNLGNEPFIINESNPIPILVKDINESFLSNVNKFVSYRDHLYFRYEGISRIDASGSLEIKVIDKFPTLENQENSLMYTLKDKLIFFSQSNSTNTGLVPYLWDGTELIELANSQLGNHHTARLPWLKGIGVFSSQGTFRTPVPKIINNVLIYMGDDGNSRTIWRTDGTPSGTFKINDTNFQLGHVNEFLEFDGLVYFKTIESPTQYWATDGTNAWQVNQIIPALDYSFYGYLNNKIIGNNMLASQNFELSFTDGVNGTSNIIPVDLNSTKYEIAKFGWKTVNNKCFFVVENDIYGSELWATDGNTAYLVKDIIQGSRSSFQDFPENYYYDYSFVGLKDTLYFITRHQTLGRQLWKTAGTEASTEMLTQLEWGDATGLTYWRGKLYFFANNGGIYSYKLYQQEAQLTLQNQQAVYDGTPKQIEFTTDLPLNVSVLYNGEASLPVNAGTYAVTIESLDPDIYLLEETTFTITKAIQTIAHDLVADVPSGSASDVIMLNASSSSGLPVTVEVVSGPATVSEGNLVLTGGSGTVEVLITQSGNDNYEPTSASFSFHVDIVMSNEIDLNHEIKVYPNPSAQDFTIEFGATNPVSIRVIDLTGREIKALRIFEESSVQFQLDDKGIYFLTVQTKQGTIVKKVIMN